MLKDRDLRKDRQFYWTYCRLDLASFRFALVLLRGCVAAFALSSAQLAFQRWQQWPGPGHGDSSHIAGRGVQGVRLYAVFHFSFSSSAAMSAAWRTAGIT